MVLIPRCHTRCLHVAHAARSWLQLHCLIYTGLPTFTHVRSTVTLLVLVAVTYSCSLRFYALLYTHTFVATFGSHGCYAFAFTRLPFAPRTHAHTFACTFRQHNLHCYRTHHALHGYARITVIRHLHSGCPHLPTLRSVPRVWFVHFCLTLRIHHVLPCIWFTVYVTHFGSLRSGLPYALRHCTVGWIGWLVTFTGCCHTTFSHFTCVLTGSRTFAHGLPTCGLPRLPAVGSAVYTVRVVTTRFTVPDFTRLVLVPGYTVTHAHAVWLHATHTVPYRVCTVTRYTVHTPPHTRCSYGYTRSLRGYLPDHHVPRLPHLRITFPHTVGWLPVRVLRLLPLVTVYTLLLRFLWLRLCSSTTTGWLRGSWFTRSAVTVVTVAAVYHGYLQVIYLPFLPVRLHTYLRLILRLRLHVCYGYALVLPAVTATRLVVGFWFYGYPFTCGCGLHVLPARTRVHIRTAFTVYTVTHTVYITPHTFVAIRGCTTRTHIPVIGFRCYLPPAVATIHAPRFGSRCYTFYHRTLRFTFPPVLAVVTHRLHWLPHGYVVTHAFFLYRCRCRFYRFTRYLLRVCVYLCLRSSAVLGYALHLRSATLPRTRLHTYIPLHPFTAVAFAHTYILRLLHATVVYVRGCTHTCARFCAGSHLPHLPHVCAHMHIHTVYIRVWLRTYGSTPATFTYTTTLVLPDAV